MRVFRMMTLSCFVGIAAAATAAAQDFAYFGPNGPDHWGELSPAWSACSTGDQQSPVDFSPLTLLKKRSSRLDLDYHKTHGVIFNNGHTIEVETEGENVLRLDDGEYRLVQFHFHTPSEHTAAGRGFDMEVHFVHRSDAGKLAVVGAVIQRGRSSGALAEIFEHLPEAVDVREELEKPFNPRAFLPRSLANYRYAGSLTTPPCSEGVRWMVLATPITITDEHMARFNEVIHFNARPVQRRK